jgi:ABC-type uncharacterized transport system permease subunit
LLITFSAGLWNIGIEGQITLGAIFATWVLKAVPGTAFLGGIVSILNTIGVRGDGVAPVACIVLAILGGAVGGMLWAMLAGILKIFGGVNEIFGGLGLNFIATALTIYFIFGPWKRPGVASMSGTVPFDNAYWLPQVEGLNMSWWSLGIAIAGIVIIYILLKGTYFGLRLKAVGKSMRSAFNLGIPTSRYMMMAFMLCGVFAGLAGSLQIVAVYHRLIPSVSSGYGYLGLMVAMLVNYQALWVMPVSFFFSALTIGSIQLPIDLQLDSNLSGVLQGAIVLFVLLMEGVRQKVMKRGKGGAK